MPTTIPFNARRSERESTTIPISLVKSAECFRRDCAATTTDISLKGARVRTNLALAPGEWVGVVAEGEFPHAIPARVVWAREDKVSHWIFAGLEFLQASTAQIRARAKEQHFLEFDEKQAA